MRVEHIEAPPSFEGNEGRLATIIRHSEEPPSHGVHFATSPDRAQQVAVIRHPTGHDIPPHIHLLYPRQIRGTPEVLVIMRGVIRVDFYTCCRSFVCSSVLRAGDVLALFAGGHGFHVVEDVELIEVKQGPYLGTSDKMRITPVDAVIKVTGG